MSRINSIQCVREYICRSSSSFAARVSGTSAAGVCSDVAVVFMTFPFRMVLKNWLLHTSGHEVNIAIAGRSPIGEPAKAFCAEPFLERFGRIRGIAELDAMHSVVLDLPDLFAAALQEGKDRDGHEQL